MEEPVAMEEKDTPRLKRHLGFWALTACGVGDIFGAGIYALVGKIAGIAGTASWISFLIAMGVAGLTALSYAELAARFPRSSGEAQYSQEGFRSPAFSLLTGWLVLCSGVVSIAAISHAFSGYLLAMFPRLSAGAEPWVAAGFLLLLAGITFWGIRQTSLANIACTLIESFGLLLVIIVAVMFLSGGGEASLPVPVESHETTGVDAAHGWLFLLMVAQAAGLAFFAFTGFEDMANMAEEVKEPERNLPAAILTAILVTGGVYILVVYLATRVVPSSVLSESRAPLLEVVRTAAPAVPSWLFTSIALFAVGNTALLNFVMASRLLYGMSRQGLLPAWVGAVHRATRTPHHAVIVTLVVALILALSGTLVYLAGTTSVLVLLVFLIVNLSLVVLKRRIPLGNAPAERERRFRVPVWVSLLGAGACAVLVGFLPVQSLLRAGMLILAGCLVVVIWKQRVAAAEKAPGERE